MDDEFDTEAHEADLTAVADVLEGRRSYDSLDGASQDVVRAEWDARIATRLASRDLASKFQLPGRRWAIADADGNVILER